MSHKHLFNALEQKFIKKCRPYRVAGKHSCVHSLIFFLILSQK